MRKPRTAASLVLLAALTLSACDGGDGGDDPADPMSTWTPSGTVETPSNTAPTVDPLTEAPKGETARQFIRRWVALSAQMQQTGKPEAFLAVAGPECESCRDLANQVREVYAMGGQIKTTGSTVTRLHHDGGQQWTASLEGSPTEVLEPGKEGQTLPGGPYELVLYLAKSDGLWIVGDYQVKP